MSQSVEQLQINAARFRELCEGCEKEAQIFSRWKNSFEQLEPAVKELIAFFEQKYEDSVIPEEVSESVKEQLENRRDGIRLSVKSATRLMRRLNPDKPLSDHRDEMITIESMEQKIQEAIEQYKLEKASAEEPELKAEQAVEQEQEQIEVQETKDGKENIAPAEETAKRTEAAEIEEANEPVSDGEEQETAGEKEEVETEAVSEGVKENSDDKETEVTSEVQEDESSPSGDEAEAEKQKVEIPASVLVPIFESAVETNQDVLDQIKEDIQAARKRFLTFIEKGVAPVLDGLYNGEKYGKDLVFELTNAGIEPKEKEFVEEWLTIYPTLMDQIKDFLNKFSVQWFSAEVGDMFDENKHEPIGVVEDPNFSDEQIKEVARYGLIFEQPDLAVEEPFLVRPAQVIVVKNKNLESVEQQSGDSNEI